MSIFDSKEGGKYESFYDYKARWEAIKRAVVSGFVKRFPLKWGSVILEVTNIEVKDKNFTKEEQKQYLLSRRDLTVPVTGTLTLKDEPTGKVLDKQVNVRLMNLPKYTERYTFIIGGNEYSATNQYRVKAGVYTRYNAIGNVESQFNTAKGRGFTIEMDPATGVFTLSVSTANVNLYSILKKLGVPSQDMQSAWGKEIFDKNAAKEDPQAIHKIWSKFFAWKEWENEQDAIKDILAYWSDKGQLETTVTKDTLGQAYDHVTTDAILAATKKMLRVNRQEEDTDDRDSLKYKKILTVDDFIEERIAKDTGDIAKKLMYKLSTRKSLESMPSSAFTKYARDFVTQSTLSSTASQTNIMEILEAPTSVTVMGEGGISSINSIPDEVRNIHPTHMGVLDPVRTPESIKVGVMSRLGIRTFRGPNQEIFVEVRDVKANKKKVVAVADLASSAVAFPGQMETPGAYAIAMVNGKDQKRVLKKDVSYEILDGQSMFGLNANLVPMMNSSSLNRLQMASKMAPQALPLVNLEKAFVTNQMPGASHSFDAEIGKQVVLHAPEDGKVISIKDGVITIKGKSGEKHEIDFYEHFPFNQKTMLTHYLKVVPGQDVKKGDLIADSNYTKDGVLALGRNLHVAYTNYHGLTFEDGIVISKSASEKLTSEHVYKEELEIDDGVEVNKRKFLARFPLKLTAANLAKLDDNGVAKKGSIFEEGEVVIAALRKRTPTAADLALGKLSKGLHEMYVDASVKWEHAHPGETLDVFQGAKHITVTVKTHEPVQVGDKLSPRYGNKGVVSAVLPDEDMPYVKGSNRPLDAIFQPEGLVSRMNPSQIHETMLGKIVEKTGKPYVIQPFGSNVYNFVKDEMKKHGVTDRDELIDPISGKSMGNILNGRQYTLRLFKTTETAVAGRGAEGAYTINKQPAKGGFDGAKTSSVWDMWALLGHQAKNLARESATYKGERNDAYWRAIREGRAVPKPTVPFVWKKAFEGMSRQMGIDIKKDGDSIHVHPLTDKDIDKLSSGEVKNPGMVKLKDFSPEDGGLFDYELTGGLNGTKYSHIELGMHLPNPMFEEPVRVLLDITKQEFEDILSSKRTLGSYGKGPAAIEAALKAIKPASKIPELEREVTITKGAARDRAVKKLRYLRALQRLGKSTADYLISKVAVTPPEFRPVIPLPSGSLRISGSNYLYRDILQAKDAKAAIGDDLPEEHVGHLDLNLYHSVKALQGLHSPVSPDSVSRNVKGALMELAGTTPKTGFFQNNVIKKPQDISGRGVAVPMPNLKMDNLGLPERIAFEIYKPHLIRRLLGMKVSYGDAVKMVAKQDPMARSALLAEMAVRPVIVNRAPIIHKFNLMAFWPVLVPGSSIGFPSVVCGPYTLDYDGDQVNVYVPNEQSAIQDALKMLPSRNLMKINARSAVNYKPELGAITGLHDASAKLSGKVTEFKSLADAHKAFEAGTIAYNSPVKIAGLK